MIHPLRDQPRLRVGDPGVGRRDDLEVLELDGRQPLRLDPPALALDEAGAPQDLPARMPARAGARLFAATVAGAVVAVAPGSLRAYLLTGRGELVTDTVDDSPNVWRRAEKDWRALAELEEAPVDRPREVALLGGQRGGYWHWWADILPRAWMLDAFEPSAPGSLLAIPPPAAPFQRESLDLLGLAPRLEPLEPGLSRFERVTFTRGLTGGGSRYPSRRLAEYARWLRDRLGPTAAGPDRGRKLFVSRRSAASRRVVNEAELEPVLARHGFSVVDPAGMSIAEQFAAFSRATAVAGPHGAGLTNLLFSDPGTRVLELFAAPGAQGVSNYRVLSSHLGQPYGRLLGEVVGEGRSAHDLDMRIDPRLLELAIAALEAAPAGN